MSTFSPIRRDRANHIESLEVRRLMSWGVAGGVLTVNGTDADDVITVGRNSAGQLALYENNVLSRTFAWSSVGKIVINGKGGNDKVTVTAATDKAASVDGGAGNDTLNGGSGNDSLVGGTGNDLLQGNAGFDRLDDGAGRDRAFGGAGNDLFVVRDEPVAEPDEYFGGDGLDIIGYGARSAAVRVQLDDLANDGLADGSHGPDPERDNVHSDFEYVSGTAYADGLYGNGNANTFFGGGGADYIDGAGGDDTLYGGDGNDIIVGGAGADLLVGGRGHDTLHARDGVFFNDTVYGGDEFGPALPGNDDAYCDGVTTPFGSVAFERKVVDIDTFGTF